jgi:hypothetical protein
LLARALSAPRECIQFCDPAHNHVSTLAESREATQALPNAKHQVLHMKALENIKMLATMRVLGVRRRALIGPGAPFAAGKEGRLKFNRAP